jgi:hypothetical protein
MNPRRVDACGRGAGPWKRGAREHLEELRAKTEHIGADIERRRGFDLGCEEDGFANAHAIGIAKDARG